MRRKRKFLTFVLIVAATGMVVHMADVLAPRPTGSVGRAPTIQAIGELSELTTLKVLVADVQTTRLDGLAGGAEADLLVRAEFTVATDLSAAR